MYHLHSEVMATESNTSRDVYTADEVLRIAYDKELVFVGSANAYEMKKVDYTDHPMCKEMRKVNGAHHLPEWIRDLGDEDCEDLGVFDEFDAGKYEDEDEQVKKWNIELCTEEDFKTPWSKKKEAALQRKIKNMTMAEVEEDFGGSYDNVDEDAFYSHDFDRDNRLYRQVKKSQQYAKDLKKYQMEQKNGRLSEEGRRMQNSRMAARNSGADPRADVPAEKNRRAGRDATARRSEPVSAGMRRNTSDGNTDAQEKELHEAHRRMEDGARKRRHSGKAEEARRRTEKTNAARGKAAVHGAGGGNSGVFSLYGEDMWDA